VLVGKTLEIVKLMAAGKKLPAFDNNVNNGKKSVGIYELTPVIVTKANAKQVYANDPSRMAILK
jgi:putative multiple sugar transport system substrate-binding protein